MKSLPWRTVETSHVYFEKARSWCFNLSFHVEHFWYYYKVKLYHHYELSCHRYYFGASNDSLCKIYGRVGLANCIWSDNESQTCPAFTGVRHQARDQHSLSISTQTYMALAYFEDSSWNTSTIMFNHCTKTIGRSNLISLNPIYEGKILGIEYPSDITPPSATARLPYVQPLGGGGDVASKEIETAS